MSSVKKIAVFLALACTFAGLLGLAASADAAVPWWQLDPVSTPTNLPPGGTGEMIVSASNLGDAEINGTVSTVTLRDVLPAGIVATTVSGYVGGIAGLLGVREPVQCEIVTGSLVECTFKGTLPPYEAIEMEIGINVLANAKSGEINQLSISGGGAPGTEVKRPIVVSSAPTAYGPADYELTPFNEDGSIDTQAGSHPYGLTATFDLNRTAVSPYEPAMPKDLRFDVPPGLVGNPTPFPQCSDVQFTKIIGEFINGCPPDTAVGVTAITTFLFGEPLRVWVPVFNLKPSVGEPARFGFLALTAMVTLDTSVRTGGDYGVTVSVSNITQYAPFLSSQLTFWGVPGDPIHDQSRGWECIDGGAFGLIDALPPCKALGERTPPPFMTLPTSCTGPLQTTVQADSWAAEGSFTAPVASVFEPAMDGCNRLPFSSSISVAPDTEAGSSPSGLTVGIHVPQEEALAAEGLAPSDVKDTTVALPAGVALNPAAADGLQSCPLLYGKETPQEESEADGKVMGIDLETPQSANCPEASKVGTVEIKSPLLPNPIDGAVYLAAQSQNPFGSLVALYIAAQDPVSGVLVKLAGEVKSDPVTGQLVSTFDNTPQLPFEDLSLHFFGGDRAPLGTPAACGAYTTTASIAPWSGNTPAEPSSTFDIVSGPNGSACQSPPPFSPSLTAGTTSIQAAGFSPFTMTVSREDGQQNIQQLQLHMPPGLSGLLNGVELCGEAQANAGSCGPDSLIGETTVSVGLGGDPYSVTGGRVFITGPYEGAPFGISVVVPAKAGPYDLGTVVVRGRIEVNPITAALTVTTNSPSQGYAIPHILDGIPLQIKHVNFTTTRPGFTFNPTNCDPMSVTGSIQSVEGSSSSVSVPFQVTNCAVLGFKPQFSVSTSGKTSRANGASLHVKLTYPKAAFGSQANVKSVKVDLPKQLPSRLTTLQKACTAAQFGSDPASCPAASMVGYAKAVTPLIPVPLEGPAYFVSYGGAKFPELVVVLQGYGVTLDLHGETFISKAGITNSTFRTIPDAPVGSFELTLPQGKYSALAANGSLCASKLTMPTAFTAQNGDAIRQSTPISVTGCPPPRAKHKAEKAKHKAKKKPAKARKKK